MNRRQFILQSVKTVTLIGGAGVLQSFGAGTFPFPSESGVELRFAIASDGHYGQANTPFDEYHAAMMSWLNTEHKTAKLAFTFFNGDLIHDDPSLFEPLKKHYSTLQMPWYVSRGNHDRCDETTWKKTWDLPLNYSFGRGSTAFIVLDTSNVEGKYICPDVSWAKSQLRKFRSRKHLFVFMHITPRKWTANGIECAELVQALSTQKNLRAIFHGHDHDQDDVMIADGKSYFFDGHMGGSWGKDYRGYRIVEILKSGDVLTYQVNPSEGLRVNTARI